MGKIWKVLAVLIAALIVIIIIIAIALPRFIEIDAYQGYIQSFIKSTTGRDVEIGTVGISLWKGVEVYVKDIKVKERRENLLQPVLKAEKISAKVALVPLFRKKIRVNSVIVQAPEINYRIGEGNPFGSLLLLSNIGSFIEQGASNFSLEGGTKKGKSSFLSSFSIDTAGLGKVEVRKGAVEMQRILASGDMFTLWLDKIDLDIDHLQVPGSFSIDARASLPENGGDLTIRGTLGHLKEKEGMPLQIFLNADVLKGHIFSKPLLSLTGISVNSGRLKVKTEINGSLGGKINIQSEGKFEELLLKNPPLDIYQGKPLKGAFSFKGNMENSLLSLEEVKIHVGQSVIEIEGEVDLKESSPMLKFSVHGEAINYSEMKDLLPLLQFQIPPYIEGGTLDATLRGKAQLGSFSIKEITGESVLKDFAIMMESLPAPIQDIQCRVKISDHSLDLVGINALFQESPIEGNIHITHLQAPESTFDLNVLGGQVKGYLTFPKGAEEYYLLKMEVEKVDMSSFLSIFSPAYRDLIHGQLAGKMQLKGKEFISDTVMQSINGFGSFRIKEGRITTFGLLKQLGRILDLMGGKGIGQEETPFEYLEGQFQFIDRALKMKNLSLKASDIALKGEGTVHPDSRIDFSFHANFSQEVSQAMVVSTPLLKYRIDSNGELSFPLKVVGDINQPKVSLDLNKILKQSSKKKLLNKIKNFLNR